MLKTSIMRYSIYLLILFVAAGCSPSALPSASDEGYDEDLVSLRPEIGFMTDSAAITPNKIPADQDYSTIEPKYDVTKELDAVLDSIVKLRSDIKYVDGFTILVYSGKDREEAQIAKGKVISVLPDSSPILKYDEPNFRVKVGKYYSRLEAQKDYSALREKFSKTIIIPERIYIN